MKEYTAAVDIDNLSKETVRDQYMMIIICDATWNQTARGRVDHLKSPLIPAQAHNISCSYITFVSVSHLGLHSATANDSIALVKHASHTANLPTPFLKVYYKIAT
jgi:hypothetical protein